MDSWYSLLLEVTYKHVPMKQHRVKHKNQPNWLTSEITDSIKTRDRYKALGNDSQFKIWQHKVVNLIKISKKSNYEKLIEEGKNQLTAIWKIFIELGVGKRKSEKENDVNSIKIGDNEINDPDEIANAFNNYFVNIAENI